MNKDEFYIGWQPKAPGVYTKHIRKVIIALVAVVIGAGVVSALLQKKFSSSKFEYGQLTEVTGIYQQYPVPSLKVITKRDAFGNTTYITMPLVGYGKSGADGVIAELEKENNHTLDKKLVTFQGTLIYSDGKTLLQIDKNDHPLIKAGGTGQQVNPVVKNLGEVELTGEILDPKCYFGVMKPGRGKPHRDCAVRCIAGGISPVFYVRNDNGETDYYLIAGPNGEKMNNQLKDYIAEPVTIKARAVQHDDWIVLYLDRDVTIKRTGGLSWFKTDEISCRPVH
ncbi:MAG: hypothetical protein ACT4OJ_02420 [Bacteroidota bacterium]